MPASFVLFFQYDNWGRGARIVATQNWAEYNRNRGD